MRHRKIFVLVLGFVLSLFDVKGNVIDTLIHEQFFNFNSYDDAQIKDRMKLGINLINNDSIDQGMMFIAESLDQLSTSSMLFRKMTYSELELFMIIRDFGLKELTVEEKELRNEIVELVKTKDFDRIEKVIDKSARKNPKSILHLRLQLLNSFLTAEEPSLTKMVDELLTVIPNHGPINLLKAKILQNSEEYLESIKYLSIAIEAYPTNAYAYLEKGECYMSLNEYEKALEEFSSAVRIFPRYDYAYDRLGDAYYYQDKTDESIPEYSKALELNPKNKYYWKDRGNAYMDLGEYPSAIKDMERSIALDNQYDYALKRLGDCYYFMGKYETAILYYNKALKIDPEYKYALLRKGLCLGSLQKSNQAIQTYKRAIEIDPSYSNAYGNIGWEYYQLGEFENSIVYSQKALEFNDRAAYAMFNIAIAKLRMGDFNEAKELYIRYKAYCVENRITIADGVLQDLIALKKQNILVDEVDFILKEIMKPE